MSRGLGNYLTDQLPYHFVTPRALQVHTQRVSKKENENEEKLVSTCVIRLHHGIRVGLAV